MSGFNPQTGRVVNKDHFAPKWSPETKQAIAERLLNHKAPRDIANELKVPGYLISNVRHTLVKRHQIPSRKEMLRSVIQSSFSQNGNGHHHTETNTAKTSDENASPVKGWQPSPQEKGVVTRTANELAKWKDRYVAMEARCLELQAELDTVKSLLKKYW